MHTNHDTVNALPGATAVVEAGIDERLHIGAQVYVSVAGKVVADFARGEARPGVRMTPDSIMIWLSSTKPITAVAVAQQWEAGVFDLDDPVASVIPEFGVKGKEAITVRHLLTHTGGFRAAPIDTAQMDWDEIIQKICEVRIEPRWIPGKKAGYHQQTSWFILGEVVRRVDGRDFSDYVRESVFKPLGMNDSWIGMPPEQYAAYGERLGVLQKTENGEIVRHPNDVYERYIKPIPAGNGYGPIRELGWFYETMLNRGRRGRMHILTPQTVEAMTARQRTGMFDVTFRHVIDWGLGFIIDSNMYGETTVPYGFGPHCSSRTFGHAGYQSSLAFADPAYALVVAVVFNGAPGDDAHDHRMRAFTKAVYEDLGLAREAHAQVTSTRQRTAPH